MMLESTKLSQIELIVIFIVDCIMFQIVLVSQGFRIRDAVSSAAVFVGTQLRYPNCMFLVVVSRVTYVPYDCLTAQKLG